MLPPMKHCPDCGEDKSQSEFFKSKNGSMGLAAYCKPCNNLRGKKARGTDRRLKEVLPDGMGRCGRCKELKALSEFYTKRNGNHKTQCKACDNALTKRHHVTAAGYRLWRNAHLLRRYGITIEQYEAMWEQQEGLCKICKTDLDTVKPHLDHCHATGTVRGILCHSCNFGLGGFKDQPDICIAAAEYLIASRTND